MQRVIAGIGTFPTGLGLPRPPLRTQREQRLTVEEELTPNQRSKQEHRLCRG
jgi:hypothetical protein